MTRGTPSPNTYNSAAAEALALGREYYERAVEEQWVSLPCFVRGNPPRSPHTYKQTNTSKHAHIRAWLNIQTPDFTEEQER